jgi:hypothetical protein
MSVLRVEPPVGLSDTFTRNVIWQKVAEGVSSEPFLPSGDQGRKGGFAPLPKQHPIARRITDETPYGIKPFQANAGREIGRKLGYSQKLGILPNQTWQTVLACFKTILKQNGNSTSR